MKKMKKFLAFALAMIMCLGMATTAFAAEGDGKIVIKNPILKEDGNVESYKAYKIFSVTTSGSGENTKYGYKLDNTSAVYAQLKALADAETPSNGVVVTSTTANGEYNVEVTDAPAFAAYLKGLNLAEGGLTGAYNESSKEVVITIPANALGYYFISTTSGTLANLTTAETAGGEVTIYDKNEKPEIEKTTTVVEGVELGQNVPYTITGKVPSTVGYESYKYIVSDKMGTGLTFNDDVVVTVGDIVIYQNGQTTEAAPAGGLTIGGESTEYDFKLTFDMTKFTVDALVKIEYSATVNEEAVKVEETGTLTNKASLEYSKDPNSEETEKTPDEVVTVYTANIVVDKVDGGTKNVGDNGEATYTTRLQGAKFVLKNSENKFYKYDETTKKVNWVDEESGATSVTTDNNGAASFKGLKDGTYKLVETEAPAGYNLMDTEQEVVVAHENNDTTLVTATAVIENNAGNLLPSTGGIGTTIFYVVGGILVVAAGVLLITKKRMSKEQ